MFARSISVLSFSAAVVVGGCSAADERYCKLGASRVAAGTESKLIDAIALVPHEDGAVLAWSDAFGAFARELDASGAPKGVVSRLSGRCDGGLALASSEAGLAFACVERATAGDPARPGSVAVSLVKRLDGGLRARELKRYAPAGTLSEGVALAWHAARGRPELALAWHDASPDVHRVMLAADARGPAPARLLSSPASVAFAPELAEAGGRLLAVWHERIAGRTLESNVMLWVDGAAADSAPPRAVISDPDDDQPLQPFPQLAALEHGLVLGYRKPGRGGHKPGLHLVHLARLEHGALESPSRAPLAVLDDRRVGRADGVGRPSLSACMGGLVTATPRSYGGDHFIGINWLSPRFSRPRREQQFYEDAHAFTQAAAACLGTHALIALAELPQLDRAQANLHVVPYACE